MKHILLTLALLSTLSAARAESEWVPLLDGKTLAGWTDAKGNPPAPGWVVEDGVLHRKEKAGDLISVKEFSNFELEWDWKVAEGANSGLKYWVKAFPKGGVLGIEYQMIDDERHPDAKRGDNHNTASIYDIKAAAPDKAVKPAGEWNHSRIVIKNGVIEHYLNGKLAVSADTKSTEWPELIAKSKFKKVEGFAPGNGKLLLQDHGDEVWFKDIKIKELP